MTELFSIACETCRAKLKVRHESAIGQILACPKCGGMVQIIPPAGWAPAVTTARSAPTTEPTEIRLEESSALISSREQTAGLPVESNASAFEAESSRALSPLGLLSRPWVAWACVPLAAAVSALAVWSLYQRESASDGSGPTVALVNAETNRDVPIAAENSSESTADERPAETKPSSAPVAPPSKALPPLPSTAPPSNSPVEQPAAPSAATATLPANPVPPAKTAPTVQPLPASTAPLPPSTAPLLPTTTLLPSSKSEPSESVPKAADSATKPSEEPTPALPALPVVDIPARLKEEIAAINFPQVSLHDFLSTISAATTLPISFDLESMADLGAHPTDPVSVKKFSISVEELLSSVLRQRDLGFVVRDAQVLVTDPRYDPRPVVTIKHSLEGFPADVHAALVAIVQQLVEPAAWNDGGGPGKLTLDGEKLSATQRNDLQRQVRILLDKLRLARGRKPLLPQATLKPRHATADAKLALPVRVNFPGPVPLAQVVEHFCKDKSLALTLVFDRAAMHESGRWPQSEVSLVAQGKPLGKALDGMLEPLGLATRVWDDRVVEITSQRAAAERLEIEAYPLDTADESAAAARMKSLLAKMPEAAWHGAGGRGTWWFDARSKRVFVRHNQTVQRRVAELLAATP